MTYEFTPADVRYLRSAAGVAAVASVAELPLTSASHLSDVATARRLVGAEAGLVIETVLLRRRAAAKVADPDRWLFTDTALQQATAMPVAEHRATRFTGRDVHDVTCSVGVDLAALAAVDASLPRYAAVAAHLHERDGDATTAARLYAEAARKAPNLAERDHLTRQAARLNARRCR